MIHRVIIPLLALLICTQIYSGNHNDQIPNKNVIQNATHLISESKSNLEIHFATKDYNNNNNNNKINESLICEMNLAYELFNYMEKNHNLDTILNLENQKVNETISCNDVIYNDHHQNVSKDEFFINSDFGLNLAIVYSSLTLFFLIVVILLDK